MDYRCFSRRLLSPFQGTLQVVAVQHGEAESTDGLNWTLYAMHPDMVSHTGLSEVRIGTWSPDHPLERTRIRGASRHDLIERVASELLRALESAVTRLPFPPEDRYECWLLDDSQGRPLALLESSVQPEDCQPVSTARWFAGQKAMREFHCEQGDADWLVEQVNARAGRRPRALWVERLPDGRGLDTEDGHWPAESFPTLLLREGWADSRMDECVRHFLHWQAPWLLQLTRLSDARRRELEPSAWQRPGEADRIHRLFPSLFDEDGLRVARVKARLIGGRKPAGALPDRSQPEPFYPFFIE